MTKSRFIYILRLLGLIGRVPYYTLQLIFALAGNKGRG